MQNQAKPITANRLLCLTRASRARRPIVAEATDPREIGIKVSHRASRKARQNPRHCTRIHRDPIAEAARQKQFLQAFMACHEDPDQVMAERQPSQLGVPGYQPGQQAWVMPKGFVQKKPYTATDNQDTGDLTLHHFFNHATYEKAEEEEDQEETAFLAAYPQWDASQDASVIVNSKAGRQSMRSKNEDGHVTGALMPVDEQRCRWHSHVRENFADADEPVYAD